MNGMKIFGTVLVVAVMVFMIGSIAQAQQYPGILDNQWFKVKVSLKGYEIDGETVLGKGAGGGTVYLRMTYDDGGTYWIRTCTQDDYDDNKWHRVDDNQILMADIYGAVYPQVWDFDGTPILFYNGQSTYNAYPTLYTKITADGPTLKKATISTVSCAVWADLLDSGHYITGSCTISGSTIPASKVATTVPADCL